MIQLPPGKLPDAGFAFRLFQPLAEAGEFLTPYNGLRVNAYQKGPFTLGGGLNADFGREEDDADRLRGLGDVDKTIEGNVFAKYSHKRFSAEMILAHDLGSGHKGFSAELEAGYSLPVSQRAFVKPSVSAVYADDDYMDSYFSVNRFQASRSSLAQYDAEAGLKDISANLFSVYRLDKNWAVNGFVALSRLMDDAADSPIAEDESNARGGLFITYTFD